MKKVVLLLMAATLLVGSVESALAKASKMTTMRLPLYGYEYGYKAAQRYLATNPTQEQVAREWRDANDRVVFYSSSDPGQAEYWQGYADGLQYFES